MRSHIIPFRSSARLALVSFCIASGPASHVSAAPPGASELFSSTVLPVLQRECLTCHGESAQSGLDLRTSEGASRGGRRGPAIVPGQPARSLLIQAITGAGELKMPLGRPRLSTEIVKAIEKWIEEGAPWSQAPPTPWRYSPEDVWAFRPLGKYDPPAVAAEQYVNPIDAFLAAAPDGKRLHQQARVGKVTLLRRATFDLIGLPPTPEEVEAFLKDNSVDAFTKVVDRLLASPRYGERWGRHWLDVVRYADTDGYAGDKERPNAWRYRDYVIRSFNQDKPFDQFILEQVAGDEIDPHQPENLIAVGFLRMGPWEQTSMSIAAVTHQQWLDDVTHSTATVFLGLTMGCARCHDHKFDPISSRDYYSFQAIFGNTQFEQRPAAFLNSEKAPGAEEQMAAFKQLISRNQAAVAGLPPTSVPLGASEEAEIQADIAYAKRLVLNHRIGINKAALTRYQALAYSLASGVGADHKPEETFVLGGGNLSAPGDPVAPALPATLMEIGHDPAVIPPSIQGRRAALARWLASPQNPLTARVMVNRIWQGHFGKGLVETANNFGKMGKRPTNPKLLDWLAADFIQHDWRVKRLHRLIMLSDAYRNDFAPQRIDAETLRDSILAVSGELNLEMGGPGFYAEMNEDAATQPRRVMGLVEPVYRESATRQERHRRSIYMFQTRNLRDPFMEVFNSPGSTDSCERRDTTTVPLQAFSLLHSGFVRDMALAFAAHVESESSDRNRQLGRAFLLAFQRLPTKQERAIAISYLERRTSYYEKAVPQAPETPKPIVRTLISNQRAIPFQMEEDPDPIHHQLNLQPAEVSAATRALADFTLLLFNSNEFIYVY